jgi:hypothetical protein
LAFNTFQAEIDVLPPDAQGLRVRFVITGRGKPPAAASVNLQLPYRPEGAVPATLRELSWHGLRLSVNEPATLRYPVHPYNPYRNGPDPRPAAAVAVLSIPLRLHEDPARYLRPAEQVIEVTLHPLP